MRYFLFVFSAKGGSMGNVTAIWDGMPDQESIAKKAASMVGQPRRDIVITNIIEFKNEQNYNDFVK